MKKIEGGHIPLGNRITEAILAAPVNACELKTFLFLARITYGWEDKEHKEKGRRKDRARVSYDQIKDKILFSKSSVKRALKRLKDELIILQFNPPIPKKNLPGEYGINSHFEEWEIWSKNGLKAPLTCAAGDYSPVPLVTTALGSQTAQPRAAGDYSPVPSTPPEVGIEASDTNRSSFPKESIKESIKEIREEPSAFGLDPENKKPVPIHLEAIKFSEAKFARQASFVERQEAEFFFNCHPNKNRLMEIWKAATQSIIEKRRRNKNNGEEKYNKRLPFAALIAEAAAGYEHARAESVARKIAESQSDSLKRKNQPYLYDHNGNLLDDQPPTTRKESK